MLHVDLIIVSCHVDEVALIIAASGQCCGTTNAQSRYLSLTRFLRNVMLFNATKIVHTILY